MILGKRERGTVPDACLAVSPREVAGDAAAAALMVAVIGDVQCELLQRREVRFDGVEPAGVGGGEDRLHVVRLQVLPHRGVAVAAQVVHDEVQPYVVRVAGAQPAEDRQQVLMRLAFAHLADEAVGVHIVEGEQLFRALEPPIGRPETHRMSGRRPRASVERTQLQRAALVETDHRPIRRRRGVEVEDAVFFTSNSGSGDSFQVLLC